MCNIKIDEYTTEQGIIQSVLFRNYLFYHRLLLIVDNIVFLINIVFITVFVF